MKRTILFWLLLALAAIVAPSAQESTKIRQILDDPYSFHMDTIKLEGKVIKYSEEKLKNSRCYIFRDDWGDEIKIFTDKDLPRVDQRYIIMGKVYIMDVEVDKAEGNKKEADKEVIKEVVINETERLDDSPVQLRTTSPAQKNTSWVNILFVAAALLLVVIAILAILLISGKEKRGLTSYFASSIPTDSDSVPGYPEPESYIEDSSIRMAAPPEGTLKLLTGRLKFIKGYDVHKEIRFYKHPNREETEFTFGREPGTPYIHIQLKSPGVSSKHAKMLWTNGNYHLINYATTNPTIVDGESLSKDQLVELKDNCTIEMGEIVFNFLEK